MWGWRSEGRDAARSEEVAAVVVTGGGSGASVAAVEGVGAAAGCGGGAGGCSFSVASSIFLLLVAGASAGAAAAAGVVWVGASELGVGSRCFFFLRRLKRLRRPLFTWPKASPGTPGILTTSTAQVLNVEGLN